MTDSTTSGDCGNCLGRRIFLRDAMTAVAMLTGLSTLAPLEALSALETSSSSALRYPLPATDGASIDTANEVIICRSKGDVFAFALSCPHQNTALRAMPSGKGFQCPRHKSKYQPDGTFINGKATRNMDRLPITREGNEIVVDPAIAFESDTEPMKWASALVKV